MRNQNVSKKEEEEESKRINDLNAEMEKKIRTSKKNDKMK